MTSYRRYSQPVAALASFSTTFPVAENPMSEGNKLVQGLADGLLWNNTRSIAGSPGYAIATAFSPVGYDDSTCCLKTSVGISSTRHSCEATVRRIGGYAPTDGHEIEILLGFTISPMFNAGYEITHPIGGSPQAARQDGPYGTFTINGAGNWTDPINGAYNGAVVDGDVVKMTYVVTNGIPKLTYYLNGVYQWDVSDTGVGKITSGQPGIGFFCRGTGLPAGVLDNFGWRGPWTAATV